MSALEVGFDLLSLLLDLQTKFAVGKLTARGGSTGNIEKETLFGRFMNELGIGHRDESKLEIELGKISDPTRRKTLDHLINMLDKHQLARLRLVAFNAPNQIEKIEKIKAKKAKDGTEAEPEREIITHKEKSGTLQFLESLATTLEGKSDEEQIAYLSKMNYVADPHLSAATKSIEEKVRGILNIAPREEITAELLIEKFWGEENPEPMPMGLIERLVNIPLIGADRPTPFLSGVRRKLAAIIRSGGKKERGPLKPHEYIEPKP